MNLRNLSNNAKIAIAASSAAVAGSGATLAVTKFRVAEKVKRFFSKKPTKKSK